MQAAERKLVIDKGSDFKLKLHVTEGIGSPKNMDGWSYTMQIMYAYDKARDAAATPPNDGTIMYLKVTSSNGSYTVAGDQLRAGAGFTGPTKPDTSGIVIITIDKELTDKMLTRIKKSDNPFNTEYNYHYSITVNQPNADGEDMRLLRGKLAVRV